MPNRIIKESICTSEEIDALTPSAEVMFYRLMVNADDYGRFDARMKLIASKCYPLKSYDINCIESDFNEIHAAGLISVYEVDGRRYGMFVNWAKHQQIRAKRAKFPDPECGHEIICNQAISNVPVIQSNPIQSESNPIVCAPSDRMPSTDEEGDDDLHEKPKPKQVKKAHQIPADFFPHVEVVAFAEEVGVSVRDELPKFRDYYTANGKTMKDWQAAFRNWLRNSKQFAKPSKPAQRSPVADEFASKDYGTGGLL